MIHRNVFATLLALCALLLAVGCTQVMEPVPTDADLPSAYPAAAPSATVSVDGTPGYPVMLPEIVVSGEEGENGEDAYPVPGGAVQAAPNLSLVNAELIEQREAPGEAQFTVLRVRLISSEPAQGMEDRLAGLVGQEVDLYAQTEGLPVLAPGESFTAEVSMGGDERGQRFVIRQFVE